MSFCWPLMPFDALVAFHQRDPQGYEKYRAIQLTRAVVRAPIEHRPALLDTLRRIEATRRMAKSPMDAATLAHALMIDSLKECAAKLHELHTAEAQMQTILVLDDLKKKSISRPH